MVPVALGGLALVATIFGMPLGIALWVLVGVVCRDAVALLRGDRADSRRLALLCQAMALVGGVVLGLLVVAGFDDLITSAANVAALAIGIAWVVIVVRAVDVAAPRSQSAAPSLALLTHGWVRRAA
jgi:Na+-driven multidrug efflux pump